MNVTPAQMQKVLTGNYTFTQLGFSMLITRMKTAYLKDPTPETLRKCTDETNAFIQKYARIMGADYAIISRL
jgi:hypothetical protein